MEIMDLNFLKKKYHSKKVFITGATGFKGSWLLNILEMAGAEVLSYSLEPTKEIDHFNLFDFKSNIIYNDIRNYSFLEKTLVDFNPDIIFHLAAQALVVESYKNPIETYETNVLGTLNLFQASRKLKNLKAFVNITTDKVYKNNEWIWPYRENDKLGGYDPYSSSKACVEIMSDSMVNSFFNLEKYKKDHQLLVANVRAGNVIGGGDWCENRLIPDIVRSIKNNKLLDIRSPKSIRPWQHVLEPLSGYLKIGAKLLNEEKQFAGAWNFGPNSNDMNTSVQQIIEYASNFWNALNYNFQENAFHEASTLKLDSSKANEILKWNSNWNTTKALEKTFEWYHSYLENNVILTEKQILEYFK